MRDLNKFLDENNIIKREEVMESDTNDFDVNEIVKELPLKVLQKLHSK